ncbi:winged helix-turn-helix domain-containing protein [Actinospica durhamensis]|uniref:Winged helix-turn-helix domain-containing protein n=1 Tax=Actinospica durhamensis TaxID=1508375 RepID=A0A941EU28_9ACTN|nr:BTAD domain-containing putative transcriptional regulator [Actinospica durhamensis]MBR7838112.1 winged helix-turn-helix domain-containing protein [Actinospica durhamensis]
MRFGLLGPVTVQLDAAGAPVRIEQRMPEILLAALLLNAGKSVPTVKLTTALWGYDPPPTAASSLYNHVGRLRRLLGPEGGGRIRTASVGYVIDVESGELDTAEFAALCAKATELREAGAWEGASESFAAALSLWRGEPAEGVSGLEEWEARVQELRETRLQALDARIDCDLRLGRHRQVTAELQSLALEYPLQESFHRQLMLALYRGGRQNDALSAYQKLRQSLSRELGIDPSPAVQRIHEAILDADPQLDAFSDADAPRAVVSVVDAPPAPVEGADRVDREVRQSMLNGIPVLLCPALPGSRQHAGITFRVGMADEPLARAGMTHLIEHLALHRLDVSDVHHNGATSSTVTHFLMQGSASEAVEFIHSVCESLHDLPFERLETEKSILYTEASHRELGWARVLAASRYGARGYGIPGFGELGLPAVTPDDLREWASRYFTRDNAVLWFSGDELPAGLDPRLPAGQRRSLPTPSSVLPTTPAYISGGPQGLVGLSAVVGRGPAARLFTELLERELVKHLRHESGLSYAISADYAARDAGRAEIHATADALPATQDKLISSLMDVLARLREGEIDPALLEVVRGRVLEARQAPDAAAQALPGLAADLLFGRPLTSEAALLDRFRTSTAEDVRAAAAEALGSALLLLPGHSPDVQKAGYAPVPTGSAVTAIGPTYQGFDGPGTQLVVGASALSLHRNGSFATVQYAECEAMQAWPDGARRLWNRDGARVAIEPNLFAAPPGFLAPLDAAIPAQRVIWQPARDPRQIPVYPPGVEPKWVQDRRPTRTVAARIVRALVYTGFWAFFVGSVIFTTLSIIVCFDTDPADGVTFGVVLLVWLFDLGVWVLPTVLLGRRLRRYRRAWEWDTRA